MAGNIIESELTVARKGRVSFEVATRADDADIRRLLRENAMPGRIALTLEREPNYFADADLPGETKQTIVAREDGRVVCAGSCTVRTRFVNGEPRRVGYLGGLRLDGSVAGRFDIVRRGYEFFRELQESDEADYYFTSIAADNVRARRLLERGLPGIPRYEFLGEFVTVLLPTMRRTPTRGAVNDSPPDTERIISLLNGHNRRYQFAPCWNAVELNAVKALGLGIADFCFSGDSAVGALWDQRGYKQTVVRGYAPALRLGRRLNNLLTHVSGSIRLPAVGEVLESAYVSHLVAPANDPEALIGLTEKLRCMASLRGIELLVLGFAAEDPRLAALRRELRFREYHSRLYVVRWPDCGGSTEDLEDKMVAPEVALL